MAAEKLLAAHPFSVGCYSGLGQLVFIVVASWKSLEVFGFLSFFLKVKPCTDTLKDCDQSKLLLQELNSYTWWGIPKAWNSDVEWKMKWADLFPAYQTSIKKSSDGLESINKILHSDV